MKLRTCIFIVVIVLVTLLAIPVFAQEEQADMSSMGRPGEMKACDWLVGEWEVDQSFQMDPKDTTWTTSKGKAVYHYELDSCLLVMDFESEMMGIPFKGVMYETYDRMTKTFQTIWVDNMMGRMSYYTGINEENGMVVEGEDYNPDGSTVLARITIFNETPTSFDWKYEMSIDGGKTFYTTGKAHYTKSNK